MLDNCEHLLDGVTDLVERLLSACPKIDGAGHQPGPAAGAVRVRVPGAGPVPRRRRRRGRRGCVVRASGPPMAGWSSPYPDDRRRIAAICAPARRDRPGDRAGRGPGGDPRARRPGARAGRPAGPAGRRAPARRPAPVGALALDWSFGLLDDEEQAVLRRASVFAARSPPRRRPRSPGFAPLTPARWRRALARLADHSLVVVVARPAGTRYRMLETIRQYGAERMDRERRARRRPGPPPALVPGDRDPAASHGAPPRAFDEVADDLRAGLRLGGRPARVAGRRPPAGRAAGRAHLRPGAAERGPGAVRGGGRAGGRSRRSGRRPAPAAAVAWGRHAGNEAIRLYRASAEAARAAGDPRAALELTRRPS